MKFIQIAVSVLILTLASLSSAKSDKKKTLNRKPATDGSKMFSCSNAPAKVWGEYPCVFGYYKNSETITDVTYGICAGSSAAEEEEPVDVTEFKSLKNDPKLAATSPEWSKASAFDVTTESLGPATLYIKKETFKGADKNQKVRIKKDNKSIIVQCHGFE